MSDTTDGQTEEESPDMSAAQPVDPDDAVEETLGSEGAVDQALDAEEPGDLPPDAQNTSGGGMMGLLDAGGVQQLLLQDTFENPATGHTYSQADLVADVINVMRMDVKQLAALHGIDIEVNKMAPERAAELLEEVAKNNGMGAIEVFQDIEDDTDKILQQKMSDEQHETYMAFKENMLYSVGGER